MCDVSMCRGLPPPHDGTAIGMRHGETPDYSSVQAESVGVGGLLMKDPDTL